MNVDHVVGVGWGMWAVETFVRCDRAVLCVLMTVDDIHCTTGFTVRDVGNGGGAAVPLWVVV